MRQLLIERHGAVGRRVTGDVDRLNAQQGVAHEFVDERAELVELRIVAVERRVERRQVDEVTHRVPRIGGSFDEVAAHGVVAVGGLRQHDGIGRRGRAPGLCRSGRSRAQGQRESERNKGCFHAKMVLVHASGIRKIRTTYFPFLALPNSDKYSYLCFVER